MDSEVDPILIARLDALQQRLCRIPVWLTTDFKDLEVEHKPWNDQVNKVSPQLADLDTLHRDLKKLSQGDEEALTLKDAWRKYARVHSESQEILGEYLDFIGGLSIKKIPDEKINSMTDVANEFVRICAREYLSRPWLYFSTSITRQEALNKAIVRLVRLRLPKWTVWNLPLAAHEFGHVLVEDYEALRTLAEDDEALRTLAGDRELIHDVLADTFATYMIGPAYICAAISLRLEPLVASDEGSVTNNLPDIERGYAMFAVLKQMNADIQKRTDNGSSSGETGERSSPYGYGMDRLKSQWEDVLWRAMSTKELPAERKDDLKRLVGRSFGKLDLVVKNSGKYSSVPA